MTHYYEKHTGGFILKRKKVAGAIFLIAGVAVFFYFLFPVLSYQLFIANAYEDKLETPIPKDLVQNAGFGVGNLIASQLDSITKNYTDARNWYPQIKSKTIDEAKVDKYSLSIPKLKIEDAEVSTRDYELEKHLVQYFGTAIPGENGTAVIFGHSTVPSWFNPKNYKTIFATLHTIKVGDEINATVNGNKYKYKVFSIIITDPEDTAILSQKYDNSYITLVTCTPPGTTWKRLIVKAVLVGMDG